DEQKMWQRYFDNWNQQFPPETHFGVGPGARATGQSGLAHTIPETLAPIGTTGSTAGLGVSPGAAGVGGGGGGTGGNLVAGGWGGRSSGKYVRGGRWRCWILGKGGLYGWR